jgi:hypothetical protein
MRRALGFALARFAPLAALALASVLSLALDPSPAAAQGPATPLQVSLPDLIVTRLGIAPGLVRPGDPATVRLTVHNAGPAPAPASRVALYVLANPASPLDGVAPLVTAEVPALAPRRRVDLAVPVTLPVVAPGVYHAVAVADGPGLVPETNEANNARTARFEVALPDVTIESLTVAPAIVWPGRAATATVRVRNRGRVPSYPTTGDVFLGGHEAAEPDSGLSRRQLALRPIPPGQLAAYAVPFTVPAVEPGAYYAIAQLDAATATSALASLVAATTSTPPATNRPRRAVRLRVALPDLTVGALSVTPNQGSPGTSLSATVTVQNAGSTTAPSTAVGLYLASAVDTPLGDAVPIGTAAVPSLRAGASVQLSATLTVPAVEQGVYQLLAVVDPAGAIAEAIEQNNRTAAGLQVLASPSRELVVWVVDSLTRVQPTDPPGTLARAEIKAARNEYEAFQVVIRAPDDAPLANVHVVASDLVGPGVIPARNVTLYREHYIQVTTPSPGSPYPPGWWPDALIPFVHPETGAPLRGSIPAAPFNIAAGHNQPVWVEIYVPENTPPGFYRGTLAITANTAVPRQIDVTLTVWPFTLPKRTTLRSAFGDLWDVSTRHAVDPASLEYHTIARRYFDAMIAHRIMPACPEDTIPRIHEDGTVDTSASHGAMTHFMDTLEANSWQIPFGRGLLPDILGADRAYALRYLRTLYDYLERHGWAERAFVYMIDEPETASQYQEIREFAALVHEAHPNLRFLVTEQPTPDDPSFGTLDGSVDIWVPPFSRYDPDAASLHQARGEEMWSYTALWQCSGCPTWLLDYPLIHYRVPAWISWTSRLQGLLYWSTTYWPDDPWINPVGWRYPGDGILFYPGKPIGFDGPVASVRLKAIRDGMEDYEYLQLLARLDGPAHPDAIARTVASHFRTWNPDPVQLHAARNEIAAQIEALGGE